MANYIKDVGWLLDAAVVNLSESAVEAAIKANTDFQYQAGLRPKVIRISSGNCCEWCDSLEGEYEYPDVPPEVWQRHKNCNCMVEYDPGDGKRQDAHTKEWRMPELKDKADKLIEGQKKLLPPAQLEFAIMIESKPSILAQFNPISFKRELEQRGFNVQPLSRGRHKNQPFEEGGGYKVNYRGDGIIEYHPAKESRHGGRYYKIGNAENGVRWFDTKGREFDGHNFTRTGQRIFK